MYREKQRFLTRGRRGRDETDHWRWNYVQGEVCLTQASLRSLPVYVPAPLRWRLCAPEVPRREKRRENRWRWFSGRGIFRKAPPPRALRCCSFRLNRKKRRYEEYRHSVRWLFFQKQRQPPRDWPGRSWEENPDACSHKIPLPEADAPKNK